MLYLPLADCQNLSTSIFFQTQRFYELPNSITSNFVRKWLLRMSISYVCLSLKGKGFLKFELRKQRIVIIIRTKGERDSKKHKYENTYRCPLAIIQFLSYYRVRASLFSFLTAGATLGFSQDGCTIFLER